MISMVLEASPADGMHLTADVEGFSPYDDSAFTLNFDALNHFDSSVMVEASVRQKMDDVEEENLQLTILFYDMTTSDLIYSISGNLSSDPNNTGSIVSVMEALEDFENVSLEWLSYPEPEEYLNAEWFNEVDGLGKKKQVLEIDSLSLASAPEVDAFKIITQLDDPPKTIYYQFVDDVKLYTDLVRTAKKLVECRILVELDPTLSFDQALDTAYELSSIDEKQVQLFISPIVARPANAVGLKGKKTPRLVGGVLAGRHLLRDANVDVNGIPAYHNPIAGYDFPFAFMGMEMRKDWPVGDDIARKKLALARLNVLERVKYRAGIRFVLTDCLTTYQDNTSTLKLAASVDISMFIDATLVQIARRHLLKNMETYIEDALTECGRFLDSCTTKKRRLLVNSEVLGGFYTLSIVPSATRPHDQVHLTCEYHTNGTTRSTVFSTAVTK